MVELIQHSPVSGLAGLAVILPGAALCSESLKAEDRVVSLCSDSAFLWHFRGAWRVGTPWAKGETGLTNLGTTPQESRLREVGGRT